MKCYRNFKKTVIQSIGSVSFCRYRQEHSEPNWFQPKTTATNGAVLDIVHVHHTHSCTVQCTVCVREKKTINFIVVCTACIYSKCKREKAVILLLYFFLLLLFDNNPFLSRHSLEHVNIPLSMPTFLEHAHIP